MSRLPIMLAILLLCCPLPAMAEQTITAADNDMLERANQAFRDRDYDRAVALYTRILDGPESVDSQIALEYLGLVREQKSQLAHAKALYRKYLERYPEGADHDRVNQRLQALLSIDRKPRQRQNVVADDGKGSNWEIYGSNSYYYRYAEMSIDIDGDRFSRSDSFSTQSDLLSQVDMTARTRSDDWSVETRFSGGYLIDFYDDEDAGGRHGNEMLLHTASVELGHLSTDTVARIGRQYNSGDGVFGRFDGVRASASLPGSWQINVLGGRPVDLARETSVDDSERWFYGASIDFEPEDSDWDATVYAVQGHIDGEIDRQAVGGEFRYFSERHTLFALADYDTHFQQLNTVMFNGNLVLGSLGTRLGLAADFRQSPLLTTRNALIGQQVDSIDELSELYSDDEIMQFAEDRTADSQAITLSMTQPVGEDSRVYLGVSRYEYGDTETSAGVEGWEGTDGEYSYDAQFIVSNLFQEYDTHSFSLRYFDGERTRRTGVGINSRFRVGTSWRVQPRLWVEYRDNLADDSNQWALRPSIRVQYTWLNRHHFEIEYSHDWSLRDIPTVGDEDVAGNYFMSSYRMDFR